METRVLKYFLAIAEEQNITQAAKKLNITQPTLSRQIREFEERWHTELFVRQNKKLYLTEAGLFLKKRAEEILELNQKTEQELFNLSGDDSEWTNCDWLCGSRKLLFAHTNHRRNGY